MQKLLSIKQAAEMLNVSTITVRRLIKLRKLRANKIGGQFRISETDLQDLINYGRDGRK
jgi:excisionase family DNA binding protein